MFGQIFGHQRAKNEARNTKMNRVQETHPIRVNIRYEINWANSFFKKFRKPCLQTDVLEKTHMYCDENRWRFFCLLRIIQESGVYQLGVPQGQGDSSAPSTTDPLICSFCLVTTPNTRGKTVEQSIVTLMFAREFITNHHPVAPQLTNKPCTNGRLRENTYVLWWE